MAIGMLSPEASRAIEQAMVMEIDVITLEVRFSNRVAQNLYSKYGFNKVGVRKNYYSNDREDAVIMTTDTINKNQVNSSFIWMLPISVSPTCVSQYSHKSLMLQTKMFGQSHLSTGLES